MKRPRLPIGVVMLAIGGIALNLTILRALIADAVSFRLAVPLMGTLVIVNVLTVGLARLLAGRGRSRPFLSGFVIAGLVAMVAVFATCMLAPAARFEAFFAGLASLLQSSSVLHSLSNRAEQNPAAFAGVVVIVFAIYQVVLSGPVLLAALIGGFLARRLAMVRTR